MNFSASRNSSNVSPVGISLTSAAGNISSRMNPNPNIKYIYDLPYFERKELCRIFDESNQWETLGGGLMCYSSTELSEFGRAVYRGASPTDALLTAWGSQNHSILELFTLFGRLSHFRGMRVLAKFVDPKYHSYIRDPEVNNVTAELVQIEAVPPKSPVEIKPQNNVIEKASAGDGEEKKETNKNNTLNLASLTESAGFLPQIPYDELLIATDNWERGNIVGKGGFGTVFKGIWKNTAVAIKRMEQRANPAYVESQLKQSLGELRFLNSYRHDNILPLYGFCLDGAHPCLVYQYMNNGSLEDRLLCRKRTEPLSWSLRYNITRGVACGIQFLHSIGTKPLIHGDIKSANILLDRHFEAKVGDFGLAREMTSTSGGASYVKVSRVHGTRPYLPDEYLRSKKLSTKVDTFSFGIMSFEIVTGQRAYEENRQRKFLKEIFDEVENAEILKDPKPVPDNPDVFWILVKLGKACTLRLAKDRPDMVQVLKSLDGLMSQASLRTVSSHVTGLPLLFETRPGSLMPILPTGTSTTHRLSPVEMRTPSPNPNSHWMPPQAYQYNQTPKQLLDSGASSRNRSPLSSVPSPQAPLTPQMTRSQPVTIPPDQLPQAHSNISNPSNPSNQIHNNFINYPSPPQPPPRLNKLLPQSNAPAPDTVHVHESNSGIAAAFLIPIPTPNMSTLQLRETSQILPDPQILPDDNLFPVALDDFLPVFLDKSAQETEESDDVGCNTEEPTTVIPLITELGIKN